MKRYLLPLLGCTAAVWSTCSQAFVVEDIRVNGLQRVSAGTVFNALPINIGDDLQEPGVVEATRRLFRTGYFQDIRLGRDGAVLVVDVVERPAISAIELSGNKSIKSEDLLNGLRLSGLAEGEIFQSATLEGVRQELERQYVAQGRYGAKITAEVVPQPRNRVKVDISIREGAVAEIKGINIVGNSLYSNEELLELFELQPSSWSSWYSKDDKYSREKLSGDLERLRSYYLDRGYINFAIQSTQVSITPDRSQVFITVNLDEGQQYSIKEVKLAGELVVDEAQIRELMLIEPGQIFSRKTMTNTEELIARRLGNEGYTFANVTGIPRPNPSDNSVDVTFFVEPGKRAYVRRINFIGNTKTEDEVLRREMRQMEGGWASTQKIEDSKTRLDRLGFFKEVNVETPAVPGTSDQIDVNYSVEEQASGSITASVGFSQGDGMILGGNVSQNNFLGTGNRVSVGISTSDTRDLYSFSFVDPYYTVDGVSRGFSAFYNATDYDKSDISSYSSDTWGGDINFGYPISDISRLGFSLGIEDISIKEGDDPAIVISDYLEKEGDSAFNIKGTLSWSQSELNRGILATRGYSQSAALELGLPGSDVNYYRLTYRGQRFFPVSEDLTLRLRTKMGYADVSGGSRLPFYENFYAGGFGSVRGYKDNTLGPRSRAETDPDYDPVGGNVLVEGSAELIFPFPFVKDKRSLQSAFFIDGGNVFDTDCQDNLTTSGGDPAVSSCTKPKFGELRYSAGVGVTWITALGPLSFSLAKALKDKDDDDTQFFQFSLGGSF